jgi:hypothetical protein
VFRQQSEREGRVVTLYCVHQGEEHGEDEAEEKSDAGGEDWRDRM